MKKGKSRLETMRDKKKIKAAIVHNRSAEEKGLHRIKIKDDMAKVECEICGELKMSWARLQKRKC